MMTIAQRVLLTLATLTTIVSGIPFFGNKKMEPEKPTPSTMSAIAGNVSDLLVGFFEFAFVWRFAILMVLCVKFKLIEKLRKGLKDEYALMLYFAFWYIGNTKYNEYNKAALDAVGGKTAGMTMTVSTMQLGVCAVYAGLLWLIGSNPIKLCGLQWPEKQPMPATTANDVVKTLPVGFCAAAAHSSSVFALGGDPLFGQIVKAGEPVLSAVVNTVFYGKPPTFAKACCLPVIVGGVAFASMKVDPATNKYMLKFDATALYFGMAANAFAAFKGSENKKLMSDKEIKSRYGGVGNQYAVTEILAFVISLPVMFATEGAMFSKFVDLFFNSQALRFNLISSGMAFYLYNELATMTIKATGAVTASVANTAKRVIVLLYMAAVTGKTLSFEQKVGAGIAIGGVLIYSVIDDVLSKQKSKTK